MRLPSAFSNTRSSRAGRTDCREFPARCARNCRAAAGSRASSWRFGSAGRELELAVGQHVGRDGDDDGARLQRALAAVSTREAAARLRGDPRHRRRQAAPAALGELCQQRAEALPAEGVDIALARAREIHHRQFAEVLAAAERPEEELDRRLPVAEILRHRLRAGDVGLAARGILDRAVRAHQHGERIPRARPRAHCGGRSASSGRAAPDRCSSPVRGASLATRIEVRRVQPVRAEIERHAEGRGVGDAAAADAVGRLEQHRRACRRLDAVARRRCRRRRRRRSPHRFRPRSAGVPHGGSDAAPAPSGEKRPAGDQRHGYRKLCAPASLSGKVETLQWHG